MKILAYNTINYQPMNRDYSFTGGIRRDCYGNLYSDNTVGKPAFQAGNELIDRFSRATVGEPVTNEALKDMQINSFKYIGNGCYKGGMVSATDYIEQLRENGIKRFIMLCTPKECNAIQECAKYDVPIDNVYIPVQDIETIEQARDFKSKFTSSKFARVIKRLREGDCFVGCESGNIRTKRFLAITQILDPECKLNLKGLTPNVGDYTCAKIIYNYLSKESKQLLNYTPEFEAKLLETFKRILR